MKKLKNFISDRVSELQNITWPTYKQATHSMILVLIIMFITGIVLGFLDFGINELVLKIIG